MPMRIAKPGLPLLLAMSLFTTLPGQALGEPPLGLPLRSIDKTELSSALAHGEPIRHRTIDAQLIVDALAEQAHSAKTATKIEISDSTITGNLTLNGALLGSLAIRNSTVHQCLSLGKIKSVFELDLSGSHFDECVTIEGCTLNALRAAKAEFHQQFQVVGTTIKGLLEMTNAVFDRTCSFRNVHIEGSSDFSSTDFHQDARFLAWFHGVAFSNALFRKAAVFDDSHFYGPASSEFYETEFDELAKFMQVTLHPGTTPVRGEPQHVGVTPLRFDTTRFNGDFSLSTRRASQEKPAEVDFQDVLWRGRAYFSDSSMSKLQLANHCVLEKQLSLSSSQIDKLFITDSDLRGDADFINSHFKSIDLASASFGGNVEFRDSDWSKLNLENGHFERGLAFAGSCRKCEGFLAIAPDTAETWHSVASAAERGGDQVVANQAFYNEQVALHREGVGKRFFGAISKGWWGFGVRPLRTFGWLIGFVLLSALLYAKQTEPLGPGASFASRLDRFESIILFSAKSAFRSPGRSLRAAGAEGSIFRRTLHASFEVIVLVESVLAWVTLAFLLIAADKVWPSLKEVTSVFLPK